MRLPQNQVGNVSRVHRFYNDFLQENERRPSVEEIAEALHLEPEKVSGALLTAGRHISMDAPLVDDEDSCLLDLLTNRDNTQTDSTLVKESLHEDVGMALNQLPKREAKVLRLFFGINCQERKLEEIGEIMHLSRERVRQIKEKALQLLRTAKAGSVLRTYL